MSTEIADHSVISAIKPSSLQALMNRISKDQGASGLFGREYLVDAATDQLEAGKHVAFVGACQTGKTTLALHCLYRLGQRIPCYYCNIAMASRQSTSSNDCVYEVLARECGLLADDVRAYREKDGLVDSCSWDNAIVAVVNKDSISLHGRHGIPPESLGLHGPSNARIDFSHDKLPVQTINLKSDRISAVLFLDNCLFPATACQTWIEQFGLVLGKLSAAGIVCIMAGLPECEPGFKSIMGDQGLVVHPYDLVLLPANIMDALSIPAPQAEEFYEATFGIAGLIQAGLRHPLGATGMNLDEGAVKSHLQAEVAPQLLRSGLEQPLRQMTLAMMLLQSGALGDLETMGLDTSRLASQGFESLNPAIAVDFQENTYQVVKTLDEKALQLAFATESDFVAEQGQLIEDCLNLLYVQGRFERIATLCQVFGFNHPTVFDFIARHGMHLSAYGCPQLVNEAVEGLTELSYKAKAEAARREEADKCVAALNKEELAKRPAMLKKAVSACRRISGNKAPTGSDALLSRQVDQKVDGNVEGVAKNLDNRRRALMGEAVELYHAVLMDGTVRATLMFQLFADELRQLKQEDPSDYYDDFCREAQICHAILKIMGLFRKDEDILRKMPPCRQAEDDLLLKDLIVMVKVIRILVGGDVDKAYHILLLAKNQSQALLADFLLASVKEVACRLMGDFATIQQLSAEAICEKGLDVYESCLLGRYGKLIHELCVWERAQAFPYEDCERGVSYAASRKDLVVSASLLIILSIHDVKGKGYVKGQARCRLALGMSKLMGSDTAEAISQSIHNLLQVALGGELKKSGKNPETSPEITAQAGVPAGAASDTAVQPERRQSAKACNAFKGKREALKQGAFLSACNLLEASLVIQHPSDKDIQWFRRHMGKPQPQVMWLIDLFLRVRPKTALFIKAALPASWQYQLNKYTMSQIAREAAKPASSQGLEDFIQLEKWDKELKIHLLGDARIELGDKLLDDKCWKRKAARAILFHLAVTPGHSLKRTQLIEYLWPDADFYAGRNSLYTAISSLKKTLGQSKHENQYLTATEGAIALNGQLVYCDIDDFERIANEAFTSEKHGDAALYLCEEIRKLYKGNLYVPQDDMSGQFIRKYETIKSLYTDCMVLGSEVALSQGKVRKALWFAQLGKEANPLREDVVAAMLRALGQSGRLLEASRYFADFNKMSLQTCGKVPSTSIRQIYELVMKEVQRAPEPVG